MARYFEARGDLALTHPNVWLGTSVEMQLYVRRATAVAELTAAVRFLSCEPLLGPLDLRSVLKPGGINWVIVGGESGHQARPMNPQWVRDIRDQCRDSGVAFFFKQWGGHRKKEAGRLLDRRTWDQMPVPCAS
jgi:protein gp37